MEAVTQSPRGRRRSAAGNPRGSTDQRRERRLSATAVNSDVFAGLRFRFTREHWLNDSVSQKQHPLARQVRTRPPSHQQCLPVPHESGDAIPHRAQGGPPGAFTLRVKRKETHKTRYRLDCTCLHHHDIVRCEHSQKEQETS